MPRQRKKLAFDTPGQTAQVTVWNKAKTRKWEMTYKVLEVKEPKPRRKGKAKPAQKAQPATKAKPAGKATAKPKTKARPKAKAKPKAKRARSAK